MTDQYADNPKVFGRWQPRMLEPTRRPRRSAVAGAPQAELDKGLFELMVMAPDKVDVLEGWSSGREEG